MVHGWGLSGGLKKAYSWMILSVWMMTEELRPSDNWPPQVHQCAMKALMISLAEWLGLVIYTFHLVTSQLHSSSSSPTSSSYAVAKPYSAPCSFPRTEERREAVRNPVVVGCLLLPNITTPSQIIFITLSSGVHCLSYWMTLLMSNMDRTVITTQNLSNLPKFVRLLRL